MTGCGMTPEEAARIYGALNLPAVTAWAPSGEIIWHNAAAQRLFHAVDSAKNIRELLGSGAGVEAWERACAGEAVEAELCGFPAEAIVLVPLSGDGVLIHAGAPADAAAGVTERMMQAMSNQIRTPLSEQFSMLGGVADKARAAGAAVDAELAEISRCGYSILRAQNNMLRYCRILTGTESLNSVRFDIAASLRGLCEAVRFFAIGLGIPFEYSVGDEPVYVAADQEKLTYAVLELLLNSFQYTREGNRVKLELNASGTEARVLVGDKGMGMEQGTLERAFEPFYAKTPGMSRPQTVGLGLTLARMFARGTGGELTLLSIEHEGTAAMLVLPRDTGEGTNVSASESAVDMLSNRFAPIYIVMAELMAPPAPGGDFGTDGA